MRTQYADEEVGAIQALADGWPDVTMAQPEALRASYLKRFWFPALPVRGRGNVLTCAGGPTDVGGMCSVALLSLPVNQGWKRNRPQGEEAVKST